MAKRPDAEWRVISAALTLAESGGWRRLGLAAIAEEAGLSLAETYALLPGKPAILDGFARRMDRAVLEGGAATDEDETPRDRLFELLMRRLEVMRPHKAGLKAVLRDTVIVDPVASLQGLINLCRAMTVTLEAAGIPAGGIGGRMRVRGLGLVFLGALRVWLGDESKDMAPSMAALDRALAGAERLTSPGAFRRGTTDPTGGEA